MGRAPCCDKANVKKGPWSPEEDSKLKEYMEKYGTGGNWIALPQKAGLKRCGKSCRLRWLNYLRPNIKHGEFSDEEDRIICSLFANIGSRWSMIAAQLPGRTDNDIKNYWNTKLKKKLMGLVNNNQPPLSHRKNVIPPLLFPSTHETSSTATTTTNCMSFPIMSQASLLSPSSSSASLYRDHDYYYNSYNYNTSSTTRSSGLENHQISNIISSSANSSLFQAQTTQESLLVGLSYNNYMPVINKDHNLLVFGSEGRSCSTSSDGSCNQISYGGCREIKKEEQIMGFYHNQGNYMGISGFDQEQINQRSFMLNYGGGGGENLNLWGQKSNGYFGESTPLLTEEKYSCGNLEDVKQLISSGNSGININNKNNGSNNSFFQY